MALIDRLIRAGILREIDDPDTPATGAVEIPADELAAHEASLDAELAGPEIPDFTQTREKPEAEVVIPTEALRLSVEDTDALVRQELDEAAQPAFSHVEALFGSLEMAIPDEDARLRAALQAAEATQQLSPAHVLFDLDECIGVTNARELEIIGRRDEAISEHVDPLTKLATEAREEAVRLRARAAELEAKAAELDGMEAEERSTIMQNVEAGLALLRGYRDRYTKLTAQIHRLFPGTKPEEPPNNP